MLEVHHLIFDLAVSAANCAKSVAKFVPIGIFQCFGIKIFENILFNFGIMLGNWIPWTVV